MTPIGKIIRANFKLNFVNTIVVVEQKSDVIQSHERGIIKKVSNRLISICSNTKQ